MLPGYDYDSPSSYLVNLTRTPLMGPPSLSSLLPPPMLLPMQGAPSLPVELKCMGCTPVPPQLIASSHALPAATVRKVHPHHDLFDLLFCQQRHSTAMIVNPMYIAMQMKQF